MAIAEREKIKEGIGRVLVGIRFADSDMNLGFDVLRNYGFCEPVLGDIYVVGGKELVKALPVLWRLNIQFEVSVDIPETASEFDVFVWAKNNSWGKLERDQVSKPYELVANETARKLEPLIESWPIIPLTGKDLQVIGKYSTYVPREGYKRNEGGIYGAENE